MSVPRPLSCARLGLLAGALGIMVLPARAEIPLKVTRLTTNPILSLDSSESLGSKINGPSVIRVPSWIEHPLGAYYMYFAHHKGKFIRLAYADSVQGPWTVHEPGTLQLSQAMSFENHIASPDVHVDHDARLIRMYFHGSRSTENQKTGVAVSGNGIQFAAVPGTIGDAYFRVFRHDGVYYSIDGHGYLNRSSQPDSGWQMRPQPLIPPITVHDKFGMRTNVRIRHSAVWVNGQTLYLFYTRKEDAPERIVMATVALDKDWTQWQAAEPMEVLRPEMQYEGIHYPLAPSSKGGAVEVQQLRDPYLFEDGGRLYLFYAIAGEMGIAVAEMTIGD